MIDDSHVSSTHRAHLRPCTQIDSRLTERQAQVMALAGHGLSISQIANHLGLSYHTAKLHLRLAYRRLGVHTRVRAINLLHPARCPQCGCDLRGGGSPTLEAAQHGPNGSLPIPKNAVPIRPR